MPTCTACSSRRCPSEIRCIHATACRSSATTPCWPIRRTSGGRSITLSETKAILCSYPTGPGRDTWSCSRGRSSTTSRKGASRCGTTPSRAGTSRMPGRTSATPPRRTASTGRSRSWVSWSSTDRRRTTSFSADVEWTHCVLKDEAEADSERRYKLLWWPPGTAGESMGPSRRRRNPTGRLVRRATRSSPAGRRATPSASCAIRRRASTGCTTRRGRRPGRSAWSRAW